MDQTTLSMISAIGGIIGAVAALLAAGAAFRSAGIAKNAADNAQLVERRGLVRDVVSVLQAVVAETMRVDDLANKLKQGYRELSTHAGQVGGGREKNLVSQVEEKQRGVTVFHEHALKLLDDLKALRELTEEDLYNLLIEHENFLMKTSRVKEKLAHDFEQLEGEIRVYRERAIQST